MQNRPVHVLLFAAATMLVAVVGLSAGGAAAQDDGTTTTETTQLDIGGQDDGTTTETTQLDIGGQSESTTTQFGATTQDAPTRVDAGAGGTASGSGVPLPGIALAGGLIIATCAAALKMRGELRA